MDGISIKRRTPKGGFLDVPVYFLFFAIGIVAITVFPDLIQSSGGIWTPLVIAIMIWTISTMHNAWWDGKQFFWALVAFATGEGFTLYAFPIVINFFLSVQIK